MSMLFSLLQGVCGLAAFVCYILVVIAMFKSGDTVMGILSIVLCFIGYFLAMVLGWVNADKYNVRKIMPIWTGLFVAGIVFSALAFMTAPAGQGVPAIGG